VALKEDLRALGRPPWDCGEDEQWPGTAKARSQYRKEWLRLYHDLNIPLIALAEIACIPQATLSRLVGEVEGVDACDFKGMTLLKTNWGLQFLNCMSSEIKIKQQCGEQLSSDEWVAFLMRRYHEELGDDPKEWHDDRVISDWIEEKCNPCQ